MAVPKLVVEKAVAWALLFVPGVAALALVGFLTWRGFQQHQREQPGQIASEVRQMVKPECLKPTAP